MPFPVSIPEKTMPAPNCRQTRRKGESVISARGAKTSGLVLKYSLKFIPGFRKDKGRGTGNALDAVNEKKQRVLCRCALFYIMEHNLGENQAYRFDVVGIEKNRINVIQNAFAFHS